MPYQAKVIQNTGAGMFDYRTVFIASLCSIDLYGNESLAHRDVLEITGQR